MSGAYRKTCRTCGAEKAVQQFYRAKENRDGRENDCKDCKRTYNAENYALKREIRLAKRAAYERTEAGKATRRRYLENGGREVFNENRRMLRRIQQMEQQA
jgi:hypothetical protein